ncbi:Selenophosphate-dependent tRNA 2-selenouridine synthase [Cupriavidus taiwanensis]|uniref:tRNA 2-selenouridine synthase n=2 Tax=Cupriavidus taiwanensis TaxID=164546 RepID=A0A375E4Q7_9BURK|nr:Selenophosphate-dependent tRNA 2-selenouridine synthase [Cupriavidus taiwanensis]SOZ60100.1 Selenophosphate-dependent tRNA 2-selenouridine synthase [Cupriavidus taiwanensis]SOZ63798.1 Selenophosphate-dependent tRNA 2-selenouridine synthase [Cupriavidus taiwanensis]SPA06550.1 Selenophosphate-dependent tRNA 2-selenouridine synthase [Cupriavidus taiwanensis]
MRPMMRPDTADFRKLFLSGVAMLDVRAPLEFARGAFPGAVNLPLMDDAERHEVGLCYAQKGQQAAIELGHQLVSGRRKAARIAAWAEFARAHPDGYLYCFRGGLRSQLVQQWLRDAGVDYPRVTGGYKAMRGFLIETIDTAATTQPWFVVGGLTGSGKTDVLADVPASIDLEGHARHRGSAFGRRAQPQPPQIDFENALAIDVLRHLDAGWRALVVEDEGRFIGSRDVPQALSQRMQASPLVWLEAPFEARVERVLRDYVQGLAAEFIDTKGSAEGFDAYATRLREAMAAIAPRLGGARYGKLSALLDRALARQAECGEVALHRGWIEVLLRDYYDPMYDFQRGQRETRIVFRGDRDAVTDWLLAHTARQGE